MYVGYYLFLFQTYTLYFWHSIYLPKPFKYLYRLLDVLFTMFLASKTSADERPKQTVAAAESNQDYIKSIMYNLHSKLFSIIHKYWLKSFVGEIYDQIKHHFPKAALGPLLELVFLTSGLVCKLPIWLYPASFSR